MTNRLLARGFPRLSCESRGHNRMLAFFCKSTVYGAYRVAGVIRLQRRRTPDDTDRTVDANRTLER